MFKPAFAVFLFLTVATATLSVTLVAVTSTPVVATVRPDDPIAHSNSSGWEVRRGYIVAGSGLVLLQAVFALVLWRTYVRDRCVLRSTEFLERAKKEVLDSMGSRIAVLDSAGEIIAVNDHWVDFARVHAEDPAKMSVGSNYIQLCHSVGLYGATNILSPSQGCPLCDYAELAEGLFRVCSGNSTHLETEYLCKTDDDERSIAMFVTPLRHGGAVVVHRDITERKRREQTLRELSSRLIKAQEEERTRIARELHDDVNQQLALLAMDIQQLGSALPVDSGLLRSRLDGFWKKTCEVSNDVQQLSHELHSSKLTHLGLPAALKGLARDTNLKSKMHVELKVAPQTPRLNADASLALFRIAQEAVQNVAKHSQAQHVSLEFGGDERHAVLAIADDGIGFDPAVAGQSGLGLVSMEERLRFIGGALQVASAPGGGTRIQAKVPLTNAA